MTEHVFTTPYGGREIWRDGVPFAIIDKPMDAPKTSTYYVELSQFGKQAASAPELLRVLRMCRTEMEMLRRQYLAEGKSDEWVERQTYLIEECDIAIAKARGIIG